MTRSGLFCLFLTLLLPLSSAWAAGGAHIVDDSEVETPGLCHAETWTALFLDGDGYFNESPACTFKSIPFVEWGVAYQHYWGPTLSAPLFGPAIKINFQSVEKGGVGFGIGLNSEVNLNTGYVGTAYALALLSLQLNEKVRANLNAGYSQLATAEVPNAMFYGAQLEMNVSRDVMLMVETYGREPGFPGLQFGLRFTPNEGPIDFDVEVANYFDAATTRFITFGVTVRF